MALPPYLLPNPAAAKYVESLNNATRGLATLKARQLSPSIDISEDTIEELKAFQDGLGENEDMIVVIPAAGIGPGTKIKEISRSGAHLLIFDGEQEDGTRTRSIIHCSQLVVTMLASPKKTSTAQRIGFHLGSDAATT